MKYTPLKISTSESLMKELNIKSKFTGCSSPLTTIGNKQLFKTNKLLLPSELKEAFNWRHISEQV